MTIIHGSPSASSISLLFITAGILAGGYVKFTFFPEIEGDNVIASIELPAGRNVERTRVVVDRLEAEAIRLGEEYNAWWKLANLQLNP